MAHQPLRNNKVLECCTFVEAKPAKSHLRQSVFYPQMEDCPCHPMAVCCVVDDETPHKRRLD